MRERLLTAYVVAVEVAAAILVALLPPSGFDERPGAALLLIGMAGLAGARPVRLPSLRINLTASHPFVFCALAAFGPLAAILADLAGVLGAAVGRDRRPTPRHLLFNLGATVLAVAAAWGIFVALGGRPGAALPALVTPLAAGAFAYFVVNGALVAFAITLEKGRRLLATWRRSCLWTIVPFFAGVTFAVAMLGMIDVLIPWGIVLAVAPSWLLLSVYRAHPESLGPRGARRREGAADDDPEDRNGSGTVAAL